MAVIAASLVSTTATNAAEPTEYEQYLLELVNRARANPTAEVSRVANETVTQPGYWGSYTGYNDYIGFLGAASLNEGPPQLGGAAYTIPPEPKQPLAFNTDLMDTARAYVALMQANDSVSHSLGGTTVEQRMSAQGYDTDDPTDSAQNGWLPGAENNSTNATSDPFDLAAYNGDIRAETIDLTHHRLFADPRSSGRGHRLTMMVSDWREAGIALSFGTDGAFNSMYANHVFALQNDRGPFITGVAYNDTVADKFYTPEANEALGGLSVTVSDTQTQQVVGTTSTFASGGYAVAVPADGTYDVRFASSSGDVDEVITGVVVGAENVKVDAIDPGSGGSGASAFEITSIVIRGGDVTITWSSTAGSRYRVRTSTDQTSWATITSSEMTASGATSSYTDTGAASQSRRRLYQVEQF